MNLSSLLIILFGALGGTLVLKEEKRGALDVLDDLSTPDEMDHLKKLEVVRSEGALILNDELASLGLFSSAERAAFTKKMKFIPFALAMGLLLSYALIATTTVEGTLLTGLLGVSVGYIVARRVVAKRKERFYREINFTLPLVMERLVMAVESGLDIVPAVKAVVELQTDEAQLKKEPVTRLLGLVVKLTESGLSFDESLSIVSSAIDSSPLRHAFVHLGVAYKEGGDVMSPLRELSDATQAYFQEVVEEEIAKIPVKATLPLVVTFAGLVLFFLTIPIVQLSSIADEAMLDKQSELSLTVP